MLKPTTYSAKVEWAVSRLLDELETKTIPTSAPPSTPARPSPPTCLLRSYEDAIKGLEAQVPQGRRPPRQGAGRGERGACGRGSSEADSSVRTVMAPRGWARTSDFLINRRPGRVP